MTTDNLAFSILKWALTIIIWSIHCSTMPKQKLEIHWGDATLTIPLCERLRLPPLFCMPLYLHPTPTVPTPPFYGRTFFDTKIKPRGNLKVLGNDNCHVICTLECQKNKVFTSTGRKKKLKLHAQKPIQYYPHHGKIYSLTSTG